MVVEGEGKKGVIGAHLRKGKDEQVKGQTNPNPSAVSSVLCSMRAARGSSK